jgi:hypothetical protein
MRRFLLFPVLGLILVALTAAATPKDADASSPKQYLVAGVAFYNLENLFDTINSNGTYDLEFSPEGARLWDSNKYWKKIGNLARAISSFTTPETPYGPAIIGISEVENRSVVEDLVRVIDDTLVARGQEPWNLQIVHHDSPDRRGIDVALLYNTAYFTLESVNNHRLVVPSNPDLRTRDQLVVSGKLLDTPMSFIVNHWPSRLGGQKASSYLREAAGALSKAISDSLRTVNPNQGVVVMGDLNDDPSDKSCAEALGAVRDRENVKSNGFYNPFWWILDNGVGTLCYKGEWNLFDQIIVSGNLVAGTPDGLQYWKATVNNFPFLRTKSGAYRNYPHRTFAGKQFLNGYSDHYPTEIFFVKEVK